MAVKRPSRDHGLRLSGGRDAAVQPQHSKPTAPITDSFTVSWEGFTAPGTTITQYQIYWRFNQGPWSLWQNFPGTQTSASFLWPSFGTGDGLYDFEATATNNLGQITPRTGNAEAGMIRWTWRM